MQYRGFELDPFQVEAIEALAAGRSVLVSAPTGTGKTVVADWVVEDALRKGRQVVYTAPIKALSNQKFRDYCRLHGEENVGLVTGASRRITRSPVRVMTTEILRNMLLTGEQLPDLAAVVVDEIHFLDDPERGTTWEEVLIYLDPSVQVVGLSATLSNLDSFAAWLSSVRGSEVAVVREDRRAVPLRFALACREAGVRSPEAMERFHKDWARRNAYALRRARDAGRRGDRRRPPRVGAPTRHHQVFKMLWPDHAPYLYFVFSRRDAEGMARGLLRRLDRPLLDAAERAEVRETLAAFRASPGGADALDAEIARMLEHGVAFHHAGLHVMLKALVEGLYERRLVRVLYCTGTFALGINMPARTAVFEGMVRFDGRGMIQLPTREFMQMAGRAGRRGMDEAGLVVVRTDIEDVPAALRQLRGYLEGRYEPVRSRFSLSFNSVVNLLHRHPPEHIRTMVEKSFLAWHRARRAERAAEQAEALARRLRDQGWREGVKPPRGMKKAVQRLKRLRREAAAGAERTWEEFNQRVRFLRDWGYLDEAGAFNAGAKVLMHVQIAEIFTTELFLQGVFDEALAEGGPALLFGVLAGMCNDLPRGVSVHVGREHRHLGRRVSRIRRSDIVVDAEVLTGVEVTWDPQMIGLGRLWAEGRSLAELLLNVHSPTDISGDLVGAFRRAKDLAGQLAQAWHEDPDRVALLRDLVRSVSRDEVEVVD